MSTEPTTPYESRIVADSCSALDPIEGSRLTTMRVTMPRIVLAEFNTHRMFSRSSASSRAIPVERMIRDVQQNPYIPADWGANQRGMQAGEPLPEEAQEQCRIEWLHARDNAVLAASKLLDLGLHKQHTNRLLEPFMWHTVIVSTTNWSNFFNLRCHPDAHPDIRRVAENMRTALQKSSPTYIAAGSWHLPYLTEQDRELSKEEQRKVCIARCARVSYLTHEGVRDIKADLALHDRLLACGHLSPFEHVATPSHSHLSAFGNFRGWTQARYRIAGEQDILGSRHTGAGQ